MRPGFQTTGYSARISELYLSFAFREMGFRLRHEHQSPDYHLERGGMELFVEATTANAPDTRAATVGDGEPPPARGIRDLTLDLKGQNFAACELNGKDKSGIVDAMEFALTGSISRLSGEGTGGLSVKARGPHVDSRNKPEAASVTLDVLIPSLGNKKARIHRSVKAASAPGVTDHCFGAGQGRERQVPHEAGFQ